MLIHFNLARGDSHTFSTLPGVVSRFSYISTLPGRIIIYFQLCQGWFLDFHTFPTLPGLMQSQQRKASGAGRMDWLDGALNIVRSGFLAFVVVVVGLCCGCCWLLMLLWMNRQESLKHNLVRIRVLLLLWLKNLHGDHLAQSHWDIVIVTFIEMLSFTLLLLLSHYFFATMSSKSMI